MRIRRRSLPVVQLAVAVAAGGVVPATLATGAVAQGGGGPGGDGGPGGTAGPGGGGGMDGDRAGGPNVSVGPGPDGRHSVEVRNVGANRTIRVRFQHRSDAPDGGVRLRAMTVATTRSGDYRFTVRTGTDAGAGVRRFAGSAPFGYFDVTHAFPNENVSNASPTFVLNRTRLCERDVAAGNVSLYRYDPGTRTWDRLRTRVTDRNATYVTCRAESPGLSEFTVAPTTVESTASGSPTAAPEPTPTGTAAPTPTRTSTPTEGAGPGFGVALAVLALLAVVVGARSR